MEHQTKRTLDFIRDEFDKSGMPSGNGWTVQDMIKYSIMTVKAIATHHQYIALGSFEDDAELDTLEDAYNILKALQDASKEYQNDHPTLDWHSVGYECKFCHKIHNTRLHTEECPYDDRMFGEKYLTQY
tara:strand:+ start:147 stop:533 length:387 start_codon:yes stop_codon:yes gene_type:complete